ncbi:hypothetical protein VNI00_016764 [Paramarasmius palmivorus]|uniref:Uncharacterized protein n=1 Tax=Paramarasmius palmivorus TaxID=297713 RepID=A0AAW0BBJ7_9AGAR
MSSSAGDDLEPGGESSTRASSAKKPRTAVQTLQSTRASPNRQQQPRYIARKSTINPSGKSQGPGKQVNTWDARSVSTRVKANERNLKSTGKLILRHSSNTVVPTSATKSPQPTRASTSRQKASTNRQVSRVIDPSKRTKDHGQADGKAGQPKSRPRQEAKKPVWR